VGKALGQLLGRDADKVREPRVAHPSCSTLGRGALAANPDRDAWTGVCLGVERDVLEGIETALEADVLIGQQPFEDGQLLVADARPLFE
jgi:hypothetical protein